MKKLILLLSIIVLSAAAAFDASARYRGDLNGDDRVDLADMVFLAKAIKAGSTDKALDVNASGKVDDYDLQKLADIIISGKLNEDSGMNVGIGGWDDSGEDFGGTVKAPAYTTRSGDVIRFYMRDPRSEGEGLYSMEFGISESDVAPAALLFNVFLPREMEFSATSPVELSQEVNPSHRLYGTPKFIRENEDDEWSGHMLRFIVLSPDLEALPVSSGKLGRIRYSVGECWGEPVFRNCQVALPSGGDCYDVPEHGGGYGGGFRPVEVASLWLDRTDMDLTEGDEVWLHVGIDPWDATDRSLVWSSSDEGVATVFSEDGENAAVRAVGEGEAVITVTSVNGHEASCIVRVEKRFIEVQEIRMNQEDLSMTEGDSAVLTAVIEPSDASDLTVEWYSSDEGIARVEPDGAQAVVTAMAPGYAEIYAVASNGMTAVCRIEVQAKVIEVESVLLDQTKLDLIEGDIATLTATVNPADATDKTLYWSSSDDSVVTVLENGDLTAMNAGTATITVSSSNGKTATCEVTVARKIIEVTSVELDQTKLEMTEGDTAVLNATVNPEDATDKTLTWTSSDSSVATVTDKGEVKALKAGTATITVSSSNGKTATCAVSVARKTIEVTSVVLDQTNLEMTEGDSATLNAIVNPTDATDQTLTWTSSDSSVATVSDKGEVKALKAGTATITVSSSNGKTATCEVTVVRKIIEVTSVGLDQTKLEMTEGDVAVLNATVNPEDATDKTLTWTSSDSSVATVSDKGEVKALKAGTATITVSSSNGKTATCEVTVARKIIEVTGIVLSNTELKMTEGDVANLTASVNPADATDKTLTWTSSDSSIATVSDKGEVKAIKEGSAVITVKAANGVSATCKVTVESGIIAVTSVTLDKTALEMTEGDVAVLNAIVNPTDATDKTLTWTSSDSSVATVSDKGEVKALKAGTATITVSSSNGKTATCAVTVARKIIEVTDIVLSNTELKMTEGDAVTLTATVNPADATDQSVVWWTSDDNVVVVYADGNEATVSASMPGSAEVYAQASNGMTAVCRVEVVPLVIEMESIELDAEVLELEVGDTHQFVATVYPYDTTGQELEWWVDDETVAVIDQNGFVTMVGEGSTTVHVRSARWHNVEATCRLDVRSAVDGIIADDAPCDIYTTGGQLLHKDVSPSELEYLPRGIYLIRQRGKTTKLLK